MNRIDIGGLEVLKFKALEDIEGVEHCFTTRIGGYSTEPGYESLNMGFHYEGDAENARLNYEKVANVIFGKSSADMVRSDQVHKTEIRIVTESDRGKGVTAARDYDAIDGLVTDIPGIVLATVYADCTPLFFADKAKGVVGVAHSGWKGTVGKIGAKMIDLMVEHYGCELQDIAVGIGPTIGPERFEVSEPVYDRFSEALPAYMDRIVYSRKGEKWHLDLWEAAKAVLLERGVSEENISVGRMCTYDNEDLFYSYRRDDGSTGRMAAMIMIK